MFFDPQFRFDRSN